MTQRFLILPLALALLASCSKPAEQPAGSGSAAPAAPSTVAAATGQSIDFAQTAYPGFIKEVHGMSGQEPKGRWTDGASAVFAFKQPMQGKVKLHIVAQPYGPNAGKDIVLVLGGVQKSVQFKPGIDDLQTQDAEFDLAAPADTLEIRIPEPTVPPGGNRKLGLFISSIQFN